MKYLSLIIVLFVFMSCRKDENIDNPNINTSLSATILLGNTQKGYIYQALDSNIVIEIKDKNQKPYLKAKLKYNISSENGIMCLDNFNNQGIYKVAWLLGCQEGAQEAEIIVSDSADRKINTFIIKADATKNNIWNRSCNLPVIRSAIGSCFEFEEPEIIIKNPDNRLFLLANQNRLYVSINEGSSWAEIYSFESGIFGVFLKLSITNDGIMLIASESGLFKSVDGKEWTKISEDFIHQLFVIDANILFIRTPSGHYRTDDLGQSWVRLDNPSLWGLDIRQAYKIGKDKICILTSNKTVLLSEDNGQTWGKIPSTDTFYNTIDLHFHNGYLYLVNLSDELLPVIYKSSTDNISWTKLTTLTRRPSNYPNKTDIKFYKDKIYALNDSHIYEINLNGDTLAVTKEILGKVSFINTFELTTQGNLVIGGKWGKGAFYRSIK